MEGVLNFLGNVIVNGNPVVKGFVPKVTFTAPASPAYDRKQTPPSGTRQLLLELGPKEFVKWISKQKRLLVTDTTFRDAHQSLMAKINLLHYLARTSNYYMALSLPPIFLRQRQNFKRQPLTTIITNVILARFTYSVYHR